MKHIYLLQIIAGHEFDAVRHESAYPTRDMAEQAGEGKLQAIRQADKEWARSYGFQVAQIEFFG